MNASEFLNGYLDYLITQRNINRVLSNEIAYDSLRFSHYSYTDNYLLSVWDEFGVQEICAKAYDEIKKDNKTDPLVEIEKLKKHISYLTDYLHCSYDSYSKLPNLTFKYELEALKESGNREEKWFKEVVERAPGLIDIIEHIRKIDSAVHGEITPLVFMAQEGNAYAKNRLVDIYLKSILKHALYFSKRYDLDLEDCFQEASIGFLKSIEKYTPIPGYTFGNYYGMWIKQQILRNICGMRFSRRMPVHFTDVLLQIIDYCKTVGLSLEQDFLIEDYSQLLVERFQFSKDQAYRYLECLIDDLSFEELNDEDYSDLQYDLDFLPDERATATLLKEQMDEVLKTLTPREAQVLRLRYGIDCDHEHTLEEVGEEFNVTRERIRQIEAKSLRKLRHPSRSKKLADYLI